jgi:hypothetical protein
VLFIIFFGIIENEVEKKALFWWLLCVQNIYFSLPSVKNNVTNKQNVKNLWCALLLLLLLFVSEVCVR